MRRVAAALALGCAAACATPQAAGVRPLPDRAGAARALPPDTVQGPSWDPRAAEGQVLAVIFFATWCFPCLTELGVMDRLQADLGPRGLVTVGVGMDLEGRRVLAPFLEAQPVRFPVVLADDALRSGESAFGLVRELPTRFLFGRDGRLVAAWSGAADPSVLRARVEAELRRPAP